jgi:hypothetical protein
MPIPLAIFLSRNFAAKAEEIRGKTSLRIIGPA